MCRGEAFARAYEASDLKRSNEEELDAAMQQRSSLNKDTLKELAVTRATVTPFWWALHVMFKVRCFTPEKTAALAGISWGFGITLDLMGHLYLGHNSTDCVPWA